MKREDQPCMRFMRGNNTCERNMRRFDLREATERMGRRLLDCSTVLRDLCRALGSQLFGGSSAAVVTLAHSVTDQE